MLPFIATATSLLSTYLNTFKIQLIQKLWEFQVETRDQRRKMSKAKVFLTNDRVFARVKGYPAWPACVICPKGYALYKVFFYGTYQVAIVNNKNMWVFDESNKAKIGKLKIKLFGFLEAMDEIENRPEVGYLNSKSKRKYMLMKPKPIDGDNQTKVL